MSSAQFCFQTFSEYVSRFNTQTVKPTHIFQQSTAMHFPFVIYQNIGYVTFIYDSFEQVAYKTEYNQAVLFFLI